MLGRDAKIGIFLLFISALLCYGSIRLGIGKANAPGPGFFPFLAGLIIAILSLVMIIFSAKEAPNHTQQKGLLVTGRAALVSGVLLLFGLLVEKAGFFICTFFATLIMLRANGIRKWPFLLFVSILTCVGIFIGFNLLLKVRLPLGILRFGGQ